MSQTNSPAQASNRSPWDPLKISTFRYLWLATLVSNIGSWMHDVGAAWHMVTLTSSPVMIALVQTATSLPAVFILLPSGALSDIIDRRLYLIFGNIAMALTALALGVLALTGAINEWSLLGLTFLLGIGMAMIMPAWQAIVPEVVPRSELPGAILLNTMGQNVSRVIGSLIAGVIIAYSGSGAVFICNAVTFIFIISVLVKWRRIPPETKLPPEGFVAAVKTGLRYTRYSPALQSTLIRGVGFFFFASVVWALLPLIARDLLNGQEKTFSYLYAAISIGAISCTLMMHKLRANFSSDQLITYASLLFAIGITLTATIHNLFVALLSLALCGSAWVTVMTCSQVSAQTALPNWIKSRGLAVFLTFFMGSMAVGPYVWGNIAAFTNLSTAMIIAACGVALAGLFTRQWPISGNAKLDHAPSKHWQMPEPKTSIEPNQGPVMISVRYEVAEGRQKEFLELIKNLEKSRRRDGAHQWHIMEDTKEPNTYIEAYMVNTWLDHLRQHERISIQDAKVQEQIRALLANGVLPVISHFIKPIL